MSRRACRYHLIGTCRYGDKCRFEHIKRTKTEFSSIVSFFPSSSNPPLPSYLGTPHTLCGYSHSSAGVITFSEVWKAFGLDVDFSQVKYKIIISMNDVDLVSPIVVDDDESGLSQLPQISDTIRIHIIKRTFAAEETTLWSTRPWPDRFIDARKSKPSEKHFLVMVRGIENDILASVPVREDYYGCQLVWIDAWPTEDEVKQMLLFYPKFVFGIPEARHPHGN